MGTESQYHQSSAVIIIVLNSISFLSLMFVLSIYIIRWKKITSFPLRLTFYLCISCLVQNIYVFMLNPILVQSLQIKSTQPSSGYCDFEAVLKVSSDLSSIIWTTLIIYSIYASIVLRKSLENSQISYLIFGYLFSIIISIIPIFFKAYGYNTYFCWFDDANKHLEFALEMGYYYVPLWLCFFSTIFMSIKVYRTLKELGLSDRELIFFKRLMLFPLIMLGTALFATINLIYNYVTDDYPEWLDILANIGLSFQGLLNSIVILILTQAYGFNPIIREQILIVLDIKKQIQQEEKEMSELASRYDRNTSRLSQLTS